MTELFKKSNLLKILYFSHFLVSALMIVINICYEESIIYLLDGLLANIIFYIFLSFQSIIGILRIIFLIITSSRQKYKIYSILIKILIFLFILSLSTSLSISILYININKNNILIHKDCLQNVNDSDINNIFNNTTLNENIFNKNNADEIEGNCKERICIMIKESNNNYLYSYLCNFIPDFKDFIFCNKYNFSNITIMNSEIINNFTNICSPKIDLYICQTNKKKSPNSIYSNYNCSNKFQKSFILCILLSIFNIIVPLIIYVFEFILYKKILKLIYLRDINEAQNSNDKKTENTSKENGNENPKSYDKKSSELIIAFNRISKKEEMLKINKENKNKNNFKIKYVCPVINTTMNADINYIEDNNELFAKSKEDKINIEKKNKSFTHEQFEHLESNNIGLLIPLKKGININSNKKEKKEIYKTLDENSEIRVIKIKEKYIN